METLTLVLSILAVLFAVYCYVLKYHNVFKKHGIPCVPFQPILGSLLPIFVKSYNLLDLIQYVYDSFPEAKYAGFYELFNPAIVVRDLDQVKSIYVTNFKYFRDHLGFVQAHQDPLFGSMLIHIKGDKWKNVRAALSPTLTTSKVKNQFELVSNNALIFADYVFKLPEKEREVELKDVISRYTTNVIANSAYGLDIDTIKDPNNLFYVYGRKSANVNGYVNSLKVTFYRNLPWIARVLGFRIVEDKIANFFFDTISSSVRIRDQQGIYKPDILQALMNGRIRKGPALDINDIHAHAFNFIFAGSDAASTQLCFLLHHLAVNPDVQEKLQKEIDEVLEDAQGQVTYDVMASMEYMDAVVNEGMRMNPVLFFMERQCVERFELPPALPEGKPFVVEPGTIVFGPIHAIHNDPKYFENPEKFDPERFLGDNGKKIMASGAYMPFGIGPRMCISKMFTLIEFKALLFHLLTRCDVKCCPKTSATIELAKGVLPVIARKGFWVKIEPRKNPCRFLYDSVNYGTCTAESK